ncbi:hypothetical protein BCR36DRAFT_257524, partial [Piromyces finnis]
CNYYKNGWCYQGKNCPYSHDIEQNPSSQRRRQPICEFYRSGGCVKGKNCPFSHELKLFSCKYYWMYPPCTAGDNCRYSHENPSDEQ